MLKRVLFFFLCATATYSLQSQARQKIVLAAEEPIELCVNAFPEEKSYEGCQQAILLALSCSEGKCPREMVERLRKEKELEREKQKQNPEQTKPKENSLQDRTDA